MSDQKHSIAEEAYWDQYHAFLAEKGMVDDPEALARLSGISLVIFTVMSACNNGEARDKALNVVFRALTMMGCSYEELDVAADNLNSFYEWSGRFGQQGSSRG